VAEHLEKAREDILAFTAFPQEIWRQISTKIPTRKEPNRSSTPWG
jgi:putative transposase